MVKYTAIIIEPRKHPALKFVLENFINNLDDDWEFLIFYGIENKEYLFTIIKEYFSLIQNRIRLINLQIKNMNIKMYNSILYDTKFYDFINTEHFLVFQTDSLIRNKFKYFINAFTNYDYVGAPWINPSKTFGANDCNNVGNGGLSLRKKNKMLDIIKNFYTSNTVKYNEDYFFTRKYPNYDLNIPDLNLAKYFSIEQIFNEESFGIHKPWKHLNPDEYNKLIEISPEIHELELLNKEYKYLGNDTFGTINFLEENLNYC